MMSMALLLITNEDCDTMAALIEKKLSAFDLEVFKAVATEILTNSLMPGLTTATRFPSHFDCISKFSDNGKSASLFYMTTGKVVRSFGSTKVELETSFFSLTLIGLALAKKLGCADKKTSYHKDEDQSV